MASISSITLPGNNRYDLKDAKLKGIYSVKGTQNSETSQWTGNINVDSLTDGLSIAYYLPVGSSDNVTLNLTLANNTATGPIDVYMTSTKRIGTEYSAGSIVYLTYYNAGSISVNGNLSLTPRWIVSNDLKEKITNSEIDQLFGDVGTSGTIYSIMQGATSAADGHEGFVPAPVIGDQVKFLRGDGTWAIPTDTTYNVMVGATSSAPGQVGLVPAPAIGGEKKFLRGDGSWISPIANMTTTQLGDILDATIGKELKDDVDGLAEEIANVIDFRKITVITQGDLNTFNSSDQNGIYYLSNAYSTFENCPSGGGWGFLLNFTRPGNTAPSYQIIFNKDYFLFRGYSGNPATWGDWHQLIYSVTNNAPTLAWGTTSTIGTVGSTPLTVTMPANPNTTYAFSNEDPTLAWGTKSTVGTVGGTALTVTMPANPNTNTTYSAGVGLGLNGTQFYSAVPRVASNGDANTQLGQNTYKIEEMHQTASNLPSAAWYYLINMKGSDNLYQAQLALGQTTDAAYYRSYRNGTWGSWHSLINTNTWTAFKGSTTAAAGTAGYVPAPASGAANRYFRCDGTWQVPPNTWTALKAATSAADGTAGYVSAPSSSWYSTRLLAFLTSNGDWRYVSNSGIAVNNLTTTAQHYCLDARQGKVLNDKINLIGNHYFGGWKSASLTAANTWVRSASTITIPAGEYLVGIYGENRGSVALVGRVDTNPRSLAAAEATIAIPAVSNGCYGRVASCFPASFSATTTLYAWGESGTSGTYTIYLQCWAVRLR